MNKWIRRIENVFQVVLIIGVVGLYLIAVASVMAQCWILKGI